MPRKIPFARMAGLISVFLCAAFLAACSSGQIQPGSPVTPIGTGQPQSKKTDSKDVSLQPYLQEAATQAEESLDYASAAAYWGAIYNNRPGDKAAALHYARNLRYANDAGTAINVLNKALETQPGDTQLLGERAKAAAAIGAFEQALPDIDRAIAADQKDWALHSARGVLLDRLNRQSEAEAAYNQALSLSPGNPKVLNNLALSLALAGRKEEAIAQMRRAAASPDASLQIRQNLSLLLAMQGDLSEADRIAQTDLPAKMAESNTAYFQGLQVAE